MPKEPLNKEYKNIINSGMYVRYDQSCIYFLLLLFKFFSLIYLFITLELNFPLQNYFGIFYKFIDVLLYLLSLYCIKFSYRFPLILWCQTYTSFFFFFLYSFYYCKKNWTFRICKSVLSHHLFYSDFISVNFFVVITVSLFIILFYLSL